MLPRVRPRRTLVTARTFVYTSLALALALLFLAGQFQTSNTDVLNLALSNPNGVPRPSPTAVPETNALGTKSPVQAPIFPVTLRVITPAPATAKATASPVSKAPTNPPVTSPQHYVAGLSCQAHDGPDDPSEMVYWRDIPQDAMYQSPLHDPNKEEQYLTFEPDEGGWNNIRMGLETAIALAFAMGRTLVLPPKMKFYLLGASLNVDDNVISYDSFFHIDSIAAEHTQFKYIHFDEYLRREAVPGNLINRFTGNVSFPPNNRTDWSTIELANFQATRGGLSKQLWEWMRNVTLPLEWNPDLCVASIPSQREGNATERMNRYLQTVQQWDKQDFPKNPSPWRQRMARFNGHPTPVNASAVDRLRELLVDRRELCVYNETYRNARTVHALGETRTNFRLLVHFYAYIFFEDWQQEVITKRFIRDHFRYRDEIQCAAARIVHEVRRLAWAHGNTTEFDSMHVRRGDFQYKQMHLSAEELYQNNTKGPIPDGRTVFIATDERNVTFFEPLARRYNVLFLNNFTHLLSGLNPNYYGMLDQLIASRGSVFFGAYYSTFTGYINRLRGYHAQKAKIDGYETGFIDSYYYVPADMRPHRVAMRTYSAVRKPFWAQEYAAGWTNIDFGAVPADDDQQGRVQNQ